MPKELPSSIWSSWKILSVSRTSGNRNPGLIGELLDTLVPGGQCIYRAGVAHSALRPDASSPRRAEYRTSDQSLSFRQSICADHARPDLRVVTPDDGDRRQDGAGGMGDLYRAHADLQVPLFRT